MVDLAIGGYTRQQVINQLHALNGSRNIKFKYNLLNRDDVPQGELDVQSGRIGLDSLGEIKRTGSFTIKEKSGIDWLNDRIQPVFCLKMPDNKYIEWPLGIYIMSSPTRKNDNRTIRHEVDAYDASLILKEDCFDNRYRIVAGTKYASAVNTILASAGIWKINIPDHSGVISVDKEFEIGTTKLTAVNQLLKEINYTSIWVDENGYFRAAPYVIPTSREIEYEYRNNSISLINTEATQEEDLFAVPNKWIRVVSNPEKTVLVSSYTNDSATSKTSTINRGRTIVNYESVDDIADQTTLDAYVKRIAYESSNIFGYFKFSTALMPQHSFLDCIYVEHTEFGISTKYIETSWEMDLQVGGQMNHNLRRVIHI